MNLKSIIASVVLTSLTVPAFAIVDGVGDFVPTFTGTPGADVDVIEANVFYNGSRFTVTAAMAGNIGTTPGASYIWGFDRGAGTARFYPALNFTHGILFDSVITLRPDSSATITRIIEGTSTNFGVGSVQITNNVLTFGFDKNELPSQGLLFENYGWNLWPRTGAGNANISDFAPNTTNAPITQTVPEPASMLALGLGAIALVGRRKR